MALFQDVTATVEINKGEYERMVRESQTLEIVKTLLCDVCVHTDTIRRILNIEPIMDNSKPESEE